MPSNKALQTAWADRVAYRGTEDLVAQTAALTVKHHHDWSLLSRQEEHVVLHFSATTPFGVEAKVSRLEFFDRDGVRIASVPSPPLTYLQISPDSQYVIGLSQIKYMNDVQLVVFDEEARLLLRRHIASEVYRLSAREYLELRAKHVQTFAELETYSNYAQVPYSWCLGGFVYIDILHATSEPGWTGLIKDLSPAMRPSPYSPNFSGSVTNFVYWYEESDPPPRIVEGQARLQAMEKILRK